MFFYYICIAIITDCNTNLYVYADGLKRNVPSLAVIITTN